MRKTVTAQFSFPSAKGGKRLDPHPRMPRSVLARRPLPKPGTRR
ncbi:hypothetical protein AB0I53_25115 [Saccharopolyspora sp. NPDC050389]